MKLRSLHTDFAILFWSGYFTLWWDLIWPIGYISTVVKWLLIRKKLHFCMSSIVTMTSFTIRISVVKFPWLEGRATAWRTWTIYRFDGRVVWKFMIITPTGNYFIIRRIGAWLFSIEIETVLQNTFKTLLWVFVKILIARNEQK